MIKSGHPEEICEKCGLKNVTWFAPSSIWNKVARTDGFDLMLCPTCFIHMAEVAGFDTVWRVAPVECEE
jgi:hypothetical protein